ncbi:transposase, partial [Fibrobacterota bacterium]
MSGYKTRWEVRCEYRHQCPYLDGMSTKWCLDEYRRSYERESEHWRIREQQQQELRESFNIIKQLERENEELKARLKALHQKQFKKNVKTHNKVNNAPVHGSGIPSDESNNAKKRGAPTGHPGWFRKKPQKIDIHKNVPPPQKCPLCNSADLSATNEKSTHVQEDIVLTPRTVVTEFIHEMAYCNCCKQFVMKTDENELANAHIGPVTKAAAVYLRYGLNIPYRKVQKLFEVFFGMRFVPASAMAFDRVTAKRGDALYEDIREKIRVASVIHADETHWREDGENRYLWYAGNQYLAFFHIDKHRSSQV